MSAREKEREKERELVRALHDRAKEYVHARKPITAAYMRRAASLITILRQERTNARRDGDNARTLVATLQAQLGTVHKERDAYKAERNELRRDLLCANRVLDRTRGQRDSYRHEVKRRTTNCAMLQARANEARARSNVLADKCTNQRENLQRIFAIAKSELL
jgi:chromosome segregation ATPase